MSSVDDKQALSEENSCRPATVKSRLLSAEEVRTSRVATRDAGEGRVLQCATRDSGWDLERRATEAKRRSEGQVVEAIVQSKVVEYISCVLLRHMYSYT